MGLIKAGKEAGISVLADQWREYFYCSSLDNDTLMTKGQKRVGQNSSNTRGSDNIISNGAVIAVNEGQCMLIVEQGAIVELSAEAGEFVFDSSTEPSIFYGSLGESVVESFKTFMKRLSFGGDTAKDQRIYFINLKDIVGNKYGTVNPIPFRAVDPNINLDIEISLRCHGEYAYKITDPVLFYKNLAGNVEGDYKKDEVESQLKSELLTNLQPAFSRISEQGIRYHSILSHTDDIARALNDILSSTWGGHYGIKITSFGISSIKAPEEDEKMIKEMQRDAVFRDPRMAAAYLSKAQGDAMKLAAGNTATGPMMAFAGMNMANQTGGFNASELFTMGANQGNPQAGQNAGNQANAGAQGSIFGQANVPLQNTTNGAVPAAEAGTAEDWTCGKCGHTHNTGKFCSECGEARADKWDCPECGHTGNVGKFCPECGHKK